MKRIVCIGDSNTYGYDPRSYLPDRYPPEIRWTGRLCAATREVCNLGRNGQSVYLPGEFPALAAVLCSKPLPSAILVMLGTNDLLLGEPPEEICLRMERLLRFLRRSLPAAAVLLISPPPLQPGEWVADPKLPAASVRLSAGYRELANRLAIPYADAGNWNVELCYDGVHLSPAGHAAFAAGLLPVLTPLLKS